MKLKYVKDKLVIVGLTAGDTLEIVEAAHDAAEDNYKLNFYKAGEEVHLDVYLRTRAPSTPKKKTGAAGASHEDENENQEKTETPETAGKPGENGKGQGIPVGETAQ